MKYFLFIFHFLNLFLLQKRNFARNLKMSVSPYYLGQYKY